ncbi:LysE family translocator [Pseudomonas lurida]|uniref:LysE family translocator n=1 Tax=Pseudomonas quebecensis TaxID=2995174 RepID=A0ABY6QJY5_9PSED|nr:MULTISPECIES: LysE family translocator [Pseudomonas]MBA1291792.1 LysE family translocator [Pseudomonas lurida]MCP1512024.1 threonine/homoserine/homoserine lactone efflux protein [Pseudomonas rhodesiae]MCX4063987.1 LysE family translocator [Pseudomonas quebecensis]MDF9770855.1 threonine/homoserine/homoserine lactone efflux protein [Pseudomonas rhodesiae]UZW20134.1 LysE family translocator [Pseudomonas quebecensis]
MTLETWLLFSGAALIVILIPGPLSLLMISNSLNYGVRRSYPAFLGGVFASICLLSASALGLGALLLASEQLFSALKIVGALYLFYLAWQSWQQSRQPAQGADVPRTAAVPRFRTLFGRAFVLGASNPKDILFFAAFLPQFLSSQQAFVPQLLVMIATWTVLDLLCKLAYGLGAHGAAGYLRSGHGQSWFNRISAALFGAAGVAALIKARTGLL